MVGKKPVKLIRKEKKLQTFIFQATLFVSMQSAFKISRAAADVIH